MTEEMAAQAEETREAEVPTPEEEISRRVRKGVRRR